MVVSQTTSSIPKYGYFFLISQSYPAQSFAFTVRPRLRASVYCGFNHSDNGTTKKEIQEVKQELEEEIQVTDMNICTEVEITQGTTI